MEPQAAAMPFAPVPTLQLVPTPMVVVLPGAIALTTIIVLPSAKIIWWKRVKSAMETALPPVRTIIHALKTPPAEALPHATFNVLIAPYRRASTMTRVARVVVTPLPTMTANPFVEIIS